MFLRDVSLATVCFVDKDVIKINFFLQEIATDYNWRRSKARNIGGGCKLFYNSTDGRKNGIGIVVREELAESVLEVKKVSDRLMAMKLDVKESILNIVSTYASQVNNSMEKKNNFWEDLDRLIESVSK